MQIQQLYESILKSLSLVADEHGLISVANEEGELRPVMIDDLRLTLPLPEVLRSGDWGNRCAFHPLSENVMRGPSPVIEKLTTAVRVRISYVLSGLMYSLVEAAADRSRHETINPKAAVFLQTMPEADDKSLDAMVKILQAVDTSANTRLVSIYLKRGGTYNGQRVARLARVSFPILKEFERTDGTVFGVKLRRKDQLGFKELMKYLLPDADQIETYSGVGSSMVAPYFQALMDAFIKIADQLNSVIHLQRKQLEDEEFLRTDLTWVDEFNDFEKYRDLIPPLAGNEGSLSNDEPAFKAQGVVNFAAPKTTSVTGTTTSYTPAGGTAGYKPAGPTSPTVAPVVKADDAPVKAGDFNPNFSLALREKDEQEKEARRNQWGGWQQQNGLIAASATTTQPVSKAPSTGGRGLDFNQLMATRFQGSQPVPFSGPQQMAYGPPVPSVLPGGYAGRVRGVPVGQFGTFQNQTVQYGANAPPWEVAPSPMMGGFGGFGSI